MSKRPPIAFMSYAQKDDKDLKGAITKFREHLSKAVRLKTWEEFRIFQDWKDTGWGQGWKEHIDKSLDEVIFLIPIITPTFLKNENYIDEVEHFMLREKELNRTDLILPVYFIECPELENQSRNASDHVVEKIKKQQWVDWKELLYTSFDTKLVRTRMAELAGDIRDALERVAEDATQKSDSDAEAMQEKSRSENEKQDSKQNKTNVSPNERSTPAMTAMTTPTPIPTPTQVPKFEKVTVDTFVFGWNDVPGKDSSKLTGYLKNRFGVDWVENAKIEKGSNDKTINITSGKNYIYLTLDDYNTTLSMAIDDGRNAEFSGVMVDGKLNIYSGKVVFTRIMGWKFTENDIHLDAGSWLQWRNMDDEAFFTLTEANGKIPNITVRSRTYFYFNTTGIYKFHLYYPRMREAPLPQTITVTLNQSQ